MIPATEALRIPPSNRLSSKWPVRGDGNRLEPVATPIHFPNFRIEPTDSIFTIGSCFARNVEEYLFRLGYRVPTLDFSVPAEEWGARPSGILNKFTAASILQEVDRAARGRSSENLLPIISEPLIETNDGWIDLELAGWKPVTPERAIQRRREIQDLFSGLFDCQVVTLTYGLVEAWFDNEGGRFIHEAPPMALVKAHPERFDFTVLSHEEVVRMMEQTIATIQSIGTPKKIIITTSPVPMGRSFQDKDILVANTFAKSIIRSACGVVADRNESVDYFPSYEIVTLTKEPSIWGDDQLHIKDDFVGKIVSQLLNAYAEKGEVTKEAWVLIRSGAIDDALALLRNEDSPEAFCLVGLCTSKPDLLATHMGTASLLHETWLKIALFFVQHKRDHQALAAFNRALAQPGGTSDVRANLYGRRGLTLQRLGQDGSEDIAQALATRRMPGVLCFAGRYALIDGRLDDAETLFGAAATGLHARKVPEKIRGDAYLGLAEVEAKRGQRAKMENYLDLALMDDAPSKRVENVRKSLTPEVVLTYPAV